MRFKNFGLESKDEKGKVVVVKCAAKAKGPHGLDINVPFGEEVEVPEIWAHPSRFANGARKPSPIEQVAPQLKPALDADREVWEQIPPEAPKAAGAAPQQLSVKALASQLGMSEGAVAMLLEQVKAAARAAAPKEQE
jgi:hypothetical protein